jgi:hypothetical protein
MAATDFHDFWLAIAAAAPVIGLASAVTAEKTVTAEETVRQSERDIGRASTEAASTLPIPNVTYWICYTNIGLQAVALAFALYCLGTEHDLAWGHLIAGGIAVLGMFLVLAPAVWTTTRIYPSSKAARMWAELKAKWDKPKAGRAGGDGDQSGPSDDSSQAS